MKGLLFSISFPGQENNSSLGSLLVFSSGGGRWGLVRASEVANTFGYFLKLEQRQKFGEYGKCTFTQEVIDKINYLITALIK